MNAIEEKVGEGGLLGEVFFFSFIILEAIQLWPQTCKTKVLLLTRLTHSF